MKIEIDNKTYYMVGEAWWPFNVKRLVPFNWLLAVTISYIFVFQNIANVYLAIILTLASSFICSYLSALLIIAIFWKEINEATDFVNNHLSNKY